MVPKIPRKGKKMKKMAVTTLLTISFFSHAIEEKCMTYWPKDMDQSKIYNSHTYSYRKERETCFVRLTENEKGTVQEVLKQYASDLVNNALIQKLEEQSITKKVAQDFVTYQIGIDGKTKQPITVQKLLDILSQKSSEKRSNFKF